KVCSHVAILQKGKLIAAGHVDEVIVNEDIAEVGAADLTKLESILRNSNGWKEIRREGNLIQLFFPVGTASLEALNEHCFKSGITLNHLQLKKKSLEVKFFELTKDNLLK
ncbi:MAG TPA: ABC transporter ATP-binding protein, partial [Chitinophagaceae bacterium]|nr:ABC transporter ATP-binding protein [Chitinophagaceae bacterium]